MHYDKNIKKIISDRIQFYRIDIFIQTSSYKLKSEMRKES